MKRPKRGVGQCVPTILYVCGMCVGCMYVGCMYVGCNHVSGPSVLGTPNPRRTETSSFVSNVKCIHKYALNHLQYVEEVVKLSKLQQHVCLTRSSRIGDIVRDGLET